MPITATINGNSVTIIRGSMSIEGRIEERSIASFLIDDPTGVLSISRGMPVVIKDPDSTTIFAGFIDTPGRARQGATGSNLIHDIVCMDNHYLADKRLVVKVYTNQTLKYIVDDILTDYLAAEGVTEASAGDIETGPVIASAIFNYVPVSEAFEALAELSGFTWLIDDNKYLYFRDRTTVLAPWNLDSINYRPIKGSVSLSTGNPLYRNRQYIRGGTALTAAEQTETFNADGVVTAFTVGYPISTTPTITDSSLGVRTVGIKGIDTGKDYYWNKGDATVTADVVPVSGRTVEVKYYGEYPLIVMVSSSDEIAARLAIEGSGTGIVEDIVTEAQWDTDTGMRGSAKAKLAQYARGAEKFIYRTRDAGLAPGQLQKITYSPFGFSAKEMLIESVIITALGDLVYYDVSCITGPVMGSWTRFFASLITRVDKSIKIGDSLLLVLFVQSESLALVEATDLHSDAFPPDVSRWIAEPPAQGAGHHVRHEALALAETTNYLEKPTERYFWSDGAPANDGRWPYTFPIVFSDDWPLWGFFTWG